MTTPAAVEADLGWALAAVMRTYLRATGSALTDVPGGPRGFQVLTLASEGECSNQATIAQRLGIDRTVMTYLVDDLERAGMVSRRPDPADRRARQVVLSAKGTKVLSSTSARIREVERAVLGRDALQRALHRVVDLDGPEERERPREYSAHPAHTWDAAEPACREHSGGEPRLAQPRARREHDCAGAQQEGVHTCIARVSYVRIRSDGDEGVVGGDCDLEREQCPKRTEACQP